MDVNQIINTDTIKLTLIPGLIVVLVLFFWFRRSAPKSNLRSREAARQRAADADPLFDPVVEGDSTADANGMVASRRALDGMNDVVVVKRSPIWERKMAEAAQRAEPRIDVGVMDVVEPEAPTPPRSVDQLTRKLEQRAEPDPVVRTEPVVAAGVAVAANAPKQAEVKRTGLVAAALAQAARSVVPEKAGTTEKNTAEKSVVVPVKEKVAVGETRTARVDRDLENGLMLVLNIYSEGRPMRGPAVLKAVTAAGLAYGKMGIFHYLASNNGSTRPLFSLANMVEPGSFNLNNLEELSTPGLCLFANVTRPEDAMATFNTMRETAQKLADTLHATVCDERRGTLSKQGTDHIYMRIQDFQRRSRLAQAASA